MYLRFLCIIACSFATLPLSAQNPSSTEPMVRLDLMPVSLSGKTQLYYVVGGKVNKLEAYETGIGSPIFYKGPKTLRFYASEADARPRGPGEAQPAPAATVILPAGVRRTLLLPVKKPDNQLEVRALGVDDKSLSAGDYRIYNLSPVELIGMVGKKKLHIRPGQSQDISDSALRSQDEDLGVQIAYLKENKQKLIYSGMWSHSTQARNYIFMIGSGNANSPISVRKFHDLPAVASIGYEPEQAKNP